MVNSSLILVLVSYSDNNEIVTIVMSVSFISLLLHLSVNATLLQAV